MDTLQKPEAAPMPVEEPKCLIPQQSKWYRPGQGFTCRQIMLPLMVASLMSLAIVGVQGMSLMQSDHPTLLDWAMLLIPLLVLGLLIKALVFVRQSLIHPLSQIRYWVSRVESGETNARVPALATGEFNDLANDINELARRFETLNDDLESTVAVQTARLERKTQALELLYEAVTSANEGGEVEPVVSHLMRRLGELYEADAAVARVVGVNNLVLVDAYGLEESSTFLTRNIPTRFIRQTHFFGQDTIGVRTETINAFLSDEHNRSGQRNVGHDKVRQIISIPLQYRGSLLGAYQLFVDHDTDLDDESRELLQNIGQHLGAMIEQSRLDREESRLFMVDERTRVANELHDSLAQTLASLRFQVRLVDEALHQGVEQGVWEELEKLENKVEEANHELRSLIGEFRAPLQSQEVVPSVQKLVEKLKAETGIDVFFQNEWTKDTLTTPMRTDIVRIIQEALTNIRKHAEADTVRVLIRHRGRYYKIMVEDDGLGFDAEATVAGSPGEHIGRQIMAERAESLGTELKVDSEFGEGCRISLEFEHSVQTEKESSENRVANG